MWTTVNSSRTLPFVFSGYRHLTSSTVSGRIVPACYLSAKTATDLPKSKIHGSYHWIFEKVLSVSLVGLVPAACMVSHPGIDYALGIVLPLHCHMGIRQIITDYLPRHKFPIFYVASSNGLRFATLLTLYGLYLLNSKDIGITATVLKFWSL
jgi:succinate dehydrogenase hydrophobic anchor subunit